MKQFFTFIISILITTVAMAQMPQAINYQAVARNNSGQALANQAIKVRLSILNTAGGNATLYSETRNVTTNALGLFNVQIGGPGAISTTGNFATVSWANNTSTIKALKVELDINNSGAFTDMGTQSLVTVPYAFAADKAIDAINIGGHYVDTNTPNTGDLLQWDGSAWVAKKPSDIITPAKTYNLRSQGLTVNGGSFAFVMAHTPIQITVYEGQTITFVGSANLGTTSGAATQVGLTPAYQALGGLVTSFTPSAYPTVASISNRSLFTLSGVLKVVAGNPNGNAGEIAPGVYNFGIAVRNVSATPLNDNDAFTGFVLVN